VGRTLDGRYEVLERLGVGGVGVVYRGRQAHLDRLVAIKVLHQDAAIIPEWRKRFEREARALSALAHPNVVTVTDSGIDRGVPYLVMELLQGKTLADLIAEGPLPLWRSVEIARQTLRGLAFAHGKGIVHRDLKPANVFLQALPDQADHVRLLDFGMVKFLDGSSSRAQADTLTRIGVAYGTPAYMSPEQIEGSPPVDARTDVYAAGVLLFEVLAGRRPFVAETSEGYLSAHLSQPVPSLDKARPGIAAVASFQAVIERAMAKKPAARFADAGEMLAAAEAVIAKLPAAAMSRGRAEARKKPTPGTSGPAPSRSGLWRRAIVLVVLLAAGIGAAATYLRRDRATPVKTAAVPAQPQPQPQAPPAEPAPTAAALPAQPAPAAAQPPPAEPAPTATAQPPTEPAPTATAQPPTEPAPIAAAPPPPEPAPIAAAPPPPEPEPAGAQPSPPPVPSTAPPQEAPGLPGSKKRPASGSVARDPWRASVPRALRPIRARVERGVRMSQRGLQPVYTFAHQNPADPRPWLLLGHAYAQLDWYSDSVERYLRAHRVDSTSRGDPRMLADLLKVAGHPTAGPVGARAIRDIYGAEAIPALDRAIERRAGDGDTIARLARLRKSLSR
jgi:eukaryotic-like serine/threonine-protein kinase